jgi:hypothetical protein
VDATVRAFPDARIGERRVEVEVALGAERHAGWGLFWVLPRGQDGSPPGDGDGGLDGGGGDGGEKEEGE